MNTTATTTAPPKKDKGTDRLIAWTDTLRELLCYYSIIILIASVIFVYTEKMAFGDSVWMSLVSATSTGYGDFFPKTTWGRVTAVSLMHITLFAIIPLITARLAARLTVDNDAFTHEEQENMRQSQQDIRTALQEFRDFVAGEKVKDEAAAAALTDDSVPK